MKTVSALLILFICQISMADMFKCEVVDPNHPADWPVDRVEIQSLGNAVSDMKFVMQVPDGQGGFKESQEILISRNIAAGQETISCRDYFNDLHLDGDLNHPTLYSVDIYENCEKLKNPALTQLVLMVEYSATNKIGHYSEKIYLRDDFNEPALREFAFKNCQ